MNRKILVRGRLVAGARFLKIPPAAGEPDKKRECREDEPAVAVAAATERGCPWTGTQLERALTGGGQAKTSFSHNRDRDGVVPCQMRFQGGTLELQVWRQRPWFQVRRQQHHKDWKEQRWDDDGSNNTTSVESRVGACGRDSIISETRSTNTSDSSRREARQALNTYLQFQQQQQQGQVPARSSSSHSLVAALKACAVLQELDSARRVHGQAVQAGGGDARQPLLLHVRNLLVDVYAKCGSAADARAVFDSTPQRDVVSWNSMISGYVGLGMGREAIEVFAEMQRSGVAPDDRTFVGALKACGRVAAESAATPAPAGSSDEAERCLEQVRAIHRQAAAAAAASKTGGGLGVFVGTVLVDVYAKCGSAGEAKRVFEGMPARNVVTWNAVILGCSQCGEGEWALQMYAQMRVEGAVVPDERTFLSALKACSSLVGDDAGGGGGAWAAARCLVHVRGVHADLEESRRRRQQRRKESNVFVDTMLVDVYGKCGSLADARRVFDEMPQRSVVSWNAMIFGYAESGGEAAEEAWRLFGRMQAEGVVPDGRTFVSVLKALSSLVVAVAVGGEEALGRKMMRKKKDEVGVGVKQQEQQQPPPQQQQQQRWLEKARVVHWQVAESGCEADLFVATMLVDVYVKCGRLADARRVFEGMRHRTVVPWNALISGYALQEEEGAPEEALRLFARLQGEGAVAPDERTFVAVLRACIGLAAASDSAAAAQVSLRCLEQVRAVHSQAQEAGLVQAAVPVGTALVDAYARCGSLVDARKVFEAMPARDVGSWNALIMGYVQDAEGSGGGGVKALELFARMRNEGAATPDDRTLIAALKACGCAADLATGRAIHDQVMARGEIVEGARPDELFLASALIDMYGKCGSMGDAQRTFDAVPVAKDAVTWNALLAGYARHGLADQVFALFDQMQCSGGEQDGGGGGGGAVAPTQVTFLCLLTACSHVGLLDKAQHYLGSMSRDHGLRPTADHVTCMVDMLGRAGHLDRALAMAEESAAGGASAADAWKSVLAACQKWGGGPGKTDLDLDLVAVARQAFERAVAADSRDAAPYVLMANVYAAAGLQADADAVQARRLRAGVRKRPGRCWWSAGGGQVHAFDVDGRARGAAVNVGERLVTA